MEAEAATVAHGLESATRKGCASSRRTRSPATDALCAQHQAHVDRYAAPARHFSATWHTRLRDYGAQICRKSGKTPRNLPFYALDAHPSTIRYPALHPIRARSLKIFSERYAPVVRLVASLHTGYAPFSAPSTLVHVRLCAENQQHAALSTPLFLSLDPDRAGNLS